MMDLKLNALEEHNSEYSSEELLLDSMDIELQFNDEQSIFRSIEHLEFIRDYVSNHGIDGSIEAMIDDQISYTSSEDLVEKIDIAIEGLLSKVTGNSIDNTLQQIKQFADYLLRGHGTIAKTTGDQKIKFVDTSEANPIAPFIAGIAEVLKNMGNSFKTRNTPNPDEMNRVINTLQQYISTGNDILRKMKMVEMTHDEYASAYKDMYEAAREVRSKLHMLEMAKLLCPKSSTADIINKLVKNSTANDKEGKKTLKSMTNPAVNARLNSLIRAGLRIIRIILMKGYTLVKAIAKGE
ncbi:MAG: hypothetical protein IKA36_06890 [Clostridia bacterium]|nr:hypothetical protein [Clostridia bacterium]